MGIEYSTLKGTSISPPLKHREHHRKMYRNILRVEDGEEFYETLSSGYDKADIIIKYNATSIPRADGTF